MRGFGRGDEQKVWIRSVGRATVVGHEAKILGINVYKHVRNISQNTAEAIKQVRIPSCSVYSSGQGSGMILWALYCNVSTERARAGLG